MQIAETDLRWSGLQTSTIIHLAGLHFLRQAFSVNLKVDSVMLGEQRPSGTRLPPSHQGWGYRLTLPPQLFAWVRGIYIHIIISVGWPLYELSILPNPDYFYYLRWFYTLSSSNSPASASWEYGLLAVPTSLAFKFQQWQWKQPGSKYHLTTKLSNVTGYVGGNLLSLALCHMQTPRINTENGMYLIK